MKRNIKLLKIKEIGNSITLSYSLFLIYTYIYVYIYIFLCGPIPIHFCAHVFRSTFLFFTLMPNKFKI